MAWPLWVFDNRPARLLPCPATPVQAGRLPRAGVTSAGSGRIGPPVGRIDLTGVVADARPRVEEPGEPVRVATSSTFLDPAMAAQAIALTWWRRGWAPRSHAPTSRTLSCCTCPRRPA